MRVCYSMGTAPCQTSHDEQQMTNVIMLAALLPNNATIKRSIFQYWQLVNDAVSASAIPARGHLAEWLQMSINDKNAHCTQYPDPAVLGVISNARRLAQR